jgi:hypothetical protein
VDSISTFVDNLVEKPRAFPPRPPLALGARALYFSFWSSIEIGYSVSPLPPIRGAETLFLNERKNSSQIVDGRRIVEYLISPPEKGGLEPASSSECRSFETGRLFERRIRNKQ